MLFDSLFSINEQQKAKAWSDFFRELKKDMKEIYNRFGGNAEWTTFLTRFSNDLSRASNYAEFETLQSIYSKELEELQQTIATDKTQQQLLEQDEEQAIQKSFEQDLDDLQNDKLNLEIKESINKQDDKNYQYKEQLSTETKENIRENPKNSHLIPTTNLKNFYIIEEKILRFHNKIYPVKNKKNTLINYSKKSF